jgi:hypothetical protein
MEVFGILLSIPAAFVASGLYILFLIFVVRRFARASLWLWWSGVVILAFFAVELLLLATLGPVRSRAVVGPSFYPAHVALFLCGTPALANLLILRQRRAVALLWACAAVVSCTLFAFGSVLLQYAVSEALYGVNGDDGPYSRNADIVLPSNYGVQPSASSSARQRSTDGCACS